MLLSSCSGQQPGVETLSIPTAKLYCPNCGTDNPETSQICRNCQAGLPKRYLWGVGPGIATLPVGSAIGNKNRFFIKAPGLFLDTQPGGFNTDNPGISAAALPYLKLFAYRLHIPQIYAIVAHNDTDIILLEQTPFTLQDFGLEQSPADAPTTAEIAGMATPLTVAWQRAGLVRQLNWLWQMAQLWQPFALEGVVSSLLQPELLRVEGPLLRLRQLTPDSPHASQPNASQGVPTQQTPTLAALGQLWQCWLPDTQLALRPGLETLCTQLMDGRMSAAELIIIQLEQWFELATKGVDGSAFPLRFDLATRTDQGPSRKRNEDACYPSSGTLQQNATEVLTIVCDGVGGHAGGDVASSSAIDTIQSNLQKARAENPQQLDEQIATAICEANNLICEKNDAEHRQERQRMGTTVVMTLARHHLVHIAHVGDSRVYWINRYGCYPMTLDDDVACREVRLGYTLYRDVLQHPIAGSLVQALGMSGSENLHPNVSRWMLDEDCVFLLCSDGLSDYDRVEEAWQEEILPLLSGERDIVTVRDRLIELANTYNGHDNVTVSLLHCQVNSKSLLAQTQTGQATQPLPPPMPETVLQSMQTVRTALETPHLTTTPTREERSFLPKTDPEPRGRNPVFSVAMLALLATVLGIAAIMLNPLVKEWLPKLTGSPSPSPSSPVTPTTPTVTPTVTPSASPNTGTSPNPGSSPSPGGTTPINPSPTNNANPANPSPSPTTSSTPSQPTLNNPSQAAPRTAPRSSPSPTAPSNSNRPPADNANEP